MMSKEKKIDQKQVVQMARDICCKRDKPQNCKDCNVMWCKAHLHAFRAYKAGYRKQEEGEWISVEERLPETEGDYLVWNKEQQKIEIRFFYRLPPHYPVESHPEIREYFGNFTDYKRITHWMPLPEPPGMKGGGTE
jgi:outer membrane phospholipase A